MGFYFVLSLLINIISCPFCLMLNNQDLEDSVLLRKMYNVSETETEIYLADLNQLRLTLTAPGTKWCGPGSDASDYDDLGTEVETDKCCRQHDYCADIIPAGETKYNLTNESFFTRLHCSCDDIFRQCLRSTNTSTSNKIGTIYFNAIGTKCYKKDYPVTGCKTRGGWFNSKCIEYIYDTDGEMVYQWFDVLNY